MRHCTISKDEVNFQDHFVEHFWLWYWYCMVLYWYWYWYGIGMHIIANIGMVYHTNIDNDMVDQYLVLVYQCHTNTNTIPILILVWYWYWYGIGIVMALVCTSLPMHTFVMQWYAKVLVLV
jgi:hypothetical protein